MLNINYISDLHSNFFLWYNKNILWEDWLLKQTKESDCLIISWDISDNISDIEKTLDLLITNYWYKKIILTFWNHDIRFRKKDHNKYGIKNSIDKYYYLINHFHWYKDIVHVIDKEDLVLDKEKIIITWNMWWYDYSGVKDLDKDYLCKYFQADFDKMSFAWTWSNDSIYVKFNNEINWNLKFAEVLKNNLIERLELIKANRCYIDYKIIGVSHIKPSIKLEQYSPYYINYSKENWEEIIKEPFAKSKYNLGSLYMNAFYTNENIHEIYKKYWVETSIYWHTHVKEASLVEWISYYTNSFWYYGHNLISKEIESFKV